MLTYSFYHSRFYIFYKTLLYSPNNFYFLLFFFSFFKYYQQPDYSSIFFLSLFICTCKNNSTPPSTTLLFLLLTEIFLRISAFLLHSVPQKILSFDLYQWPLSSLSCSFPNWYLPFNSLSLYLFFIISQKNPHRPFYLYTFCFVFKLLLSFLLLHSTTMFFFTIPSYPSLKGPPHILLYIGTTHSLISSYISFSFLPCSIFFFVFCNPLTLQQQNFPLSFSLRERTLTIHIKNSFIAPKKTNLCTITSIKQK